MNIYKDIIIHQKLSSATQEERVLLSCGGQYYEASPAMAELVETLQRHATEEEAIAAYTEKKAGRYTPEQVRLIIDKFIIPLLTPKQQKRSFLYEKELFSAVQQQGKCLFGSRSVCLHAGFVVLSRTGTRFCLQVFRRAARRNWLRVVPQFPGPLYGCDGSVEIEAGRAMCGESCRCVFSKLVAYHPAGGLSDDGKRYLALSDSGHESGVCNDPESFLQVRRILDGIRPAGGAQPAAAFAGTAWLYMEEITQRAGRQAALPLADPSVRAIRTACLFGSSQSFYGILFPVCHSDFPIPVRTDFSRCGERADSLPVEPDDAAVCLAA